MLPFAYVWNCRMLIEIPSFTSHGFWPLMVSFSVASSLQQLERSTEITGKKSKKIKRSGEDFGLPSGKLTFCYGKWPFLMGKLTISMVIFNSYVKLPEGMLRGISLFCDLLSVKLVPRKLFLRLPLSCVKQLVASRIWGAKETEAAC